MTIDDYGRAVDCFAFSQIRGRVECSALNDFYNADDDDKIYEQCVGCPFWKKAEDVVIKKNAFRQPPVGVKTTLYTARKMLKGTKAKDESIIEESKKIIASVPDPEVRRYMEQFFLEGKTFETIADDVAVVVHGTTVAKRIYKMIGELNGGCEE